MKRLSLVALFVVLVVSLTGAATEASAYSTPKLFETDPVSSGGGGGRFFTGSPVDPFTCSVCHDAGPVGLRLEGLPEGGYDPGMTYELTLTWDGPGTAVTADVFSPDTFAGELVGIDVDALEPADYCAGGEIPGAESFVLDSGRTLVTVSPCDADRLRFLWTAPAQGSNPLAAVTLYVAAVAGDDNDDVYGDRAEARGWTLGPREPLVGETAASTCSATSARPSAVASLLALLLLCAFGRRKMGPHADT